MDLSVRNIIASLVHSLCFLFGLKAPNTTVNAWWMLAVFVGLAEFVGLANELGGLPAAGRTTTELVVELKVGLKLALAVNDAVDLLIASSPAPGWARSRCFLMLGT